MTFRLLLSALCITACVGDVAPSAAKRASRDLSPTVERDSAGVTIVENGAPAWDSTTSWRVTREPLLSIGSVDGGEKAANFAWVRDAKRLSDGRIVVMENQGHEIRWFGADGRHLYTRGGRGKGPGEFTSASALLRLPGDTIVVQNMPLIRHVFYAPDGTLVREEPLDYARYRAFGLWRECLIHLLPDRSLLGCLAEDGLHSNFVEREGVQRTFLRYVLVPWDMSAKYPLGVQGGIEQWGVRRPSGDIDYIVHPFHAFTHVASGGTPLRLAVALNPEYSIELWHTDGTLDRIIRRSGARRAATRAELQEARETMREWDSEKDPAEFNRLVSGLEPPDSIPAVLGLTIGSEGDVWVRRMPAVRNAQPTQFDIFDARGHFLGELSLPPSIRVLEVGADYVLVARFDENDVPFIEVHGLDRRGG